MKQPFRLNELRRGVVLPLLSAGLILFYQQMPQNAQVDVWFTNGFSQWILENISSVSSRVSFSLAELLALIVLTVFVFAALAFAAALLKRKGVLRALFRITNLMSVLIIVFLLFWGFNYRAAGIGPSLNLAPQEMTSASLEKLAQRLAVQAAKERKKAGIKENELFQYAGDMNQVASDAYDRLGQKYPVFEGPSGQAKPLFMSELFSRLGISGIFIPYTAEANYNNAQPMLLQPSTVLHEMAHLKGVAREEEANFAAYLASRHSDDSGFRYSASMLALINTMNQLKRMDPDAHRRVWNLYSEGMLLDLADYSSYWKKYQGILQDRANEVNDRYLKSNGQAEGVGSYANMAGFLLRYYLQFPLID